LISFDGVKFSPEKWVTVTTAWRVLRLQDVVGVQEFMRDIGGTVKAGDYNFFFFIWKIKSTIENRTPCTTQNSIISYVNGVC
jgi:hypothetical protein